MKLINQLHAAKAAGLTRDDVMLVRITWRLGHVRRQIQRVASRRSVIAYQQGLQDHISTMHGTDASVWEYKRGFTDCKVLAA